LDVSSVAFRLPVVSDLPTLVRLLADDPLGATRERTTDQATPSYARALDDIMADPNQNLVLATLQDEIVGMLQLTYIPSLTYQGSWRAQIEGVRVAAQARSAGLGTRLVEEAIKRARSRGCRMVQLTTDKARPRAIAFYESLGFVSSHEGMKLHLVQAPSGE
jgi:ribosomal protein S18 acetylase RimI-like enzyme